MIPSGTTIGLNRRLRSKLPYPNDTELRRIRWFCCQYHHEVLPELARPPGRHSTEHGPGTAISIPGERSRSITLPPIAGRSKHRHGRPSPRIRIAESSCPAVPGKPPLTRFTKARMAESKRSISPMMAVRGPQEDPGNTTPPNGWPTTKLPPGPGSRLSGLITARAPSSIGGGTTRNPLNDSALETTSRKPPNDPHGPRESLLGGGVDAAFGGIPTAAAISLWIPFPTRSQYSIHYE